MDLFQYAESVTKGPSLHDVRSKATRFWDQAHVTLINETRTDPTVASVLTEIVLWTDEFSKALAERGLAPEKDSQREIILLRRPSSWSQYVLLVADDKFDEKRSTGEATLFFNPGSLERALGKWQNALHQGRGKRAALEGKLFDTYRMLSPADVSGVQVFTVYFVRRPRRIFTSAPVPAWAMTSPESNARATAGCLVRHLDGQRLGVTSVRHFFPRGAMGTSVNIAGTPGVVVAEDAISDSVFVQMPQFPAATGRSGTKGWLKNVAPRLGEAAVFEGVTSARTRTAVAAHDPSVARNSPYRQARIYTPPVTNPGDSGAALIEESTDLIMGFAMERTEAGALIEWSSWIWADSVFSALDVNPA